MNLHFSYHHTSVRLSCISDLCRRGGNYPVRIWRFNLSTQQPTQENPSSWRRFVNTIKTFGQGAKLLIGDVRKMRSIRSTMGGFKLSGSTPMMKPSDSVQLEHIRFIYKTSADLVRTLPTLILFCIPLLGYVAPFLALMFPGQLLSSHFWSDKEKENLIAKSLQRRQESVRKLSSIAFESNDVLSLDIGGGQIKDSNSSSKSLRAFTDSIADLDKLPSRHLQLLLQSWGVFGVVIPLKWFQARRLRRHLHYIQSCDWILLRDGLPMDIQTELVKERVPLFTSTDDDCSVVLRRWLEVNSSAVKNGDVANEVFLAYMVLSVPSLNADHSVG